MKLLLAAICGFATALAVLLCGVASATHFLANPHPAKQFSSEIVSDVRVVATF